MKKLINKYLTFIKYIFSAGISFVIDLTLFTIFSKVFHLIISDYAIIVATIFARLVSSYINYHLNRNKVFSKEEDNSKIDKNSFTKYVCLVIVQTIVSSLSVYSVFKLTHINETLIKIPIECILFLVNYFVQKYLIFNKKYKKILFPSQFKPVLLFALALCTIIAFFIKLDYTSIVIYSRKDTNAFTYLVFGALIYYFYKKYYFGIQKRTPFKILSVLFTILLIFGYSFDLTDSAKLVYGKPIFIFISAIKFIGFYNLISLSLNLLYDKLVHLNINNKKNKITELFDKHPFIFCFVLLLVCYLPYIIAFYPAVLGYDPANQIKEVMGIHNRYMDSVVLINPNVTITNFNPVIHTLLLGNLFKFGVSINNVNFGLFLYSVIQIIIMLSILSYSICFLKKEKLPNIFIMTVMLIYAFIPVYPLYSLSTNKDTIFSVLIILYTIKFYQLIKYDYKTKDLVVMLIVCLFLFLMRNNGIYTIFLTLPFAFLVLKEKRKYIGITILSVLCLYVGYTKIVLPYFEITPTSIREMLSVPFQQTAALVVNDEEVIEQKDRDIIANVLNYSTIKTSYNPELADKVKNTFNKNATDEDVMLYFNVWFKYLFKRPLIYIDATVNNIYGYFYPNTSKWNLYYTYNTKLKEAGFDYHYNSLTCLRSVLSTYGEIFQYIPLLGLTINIGFTVWIYLFLIIALIVNKNKKYILVLLPALSLVLVCILSPANAYFRYALPYIMELPIILGMLYQNKKND